MVGYFSSRVLRPLRASTGLAARLGFSDGNYSLLSVSIMESSSNFLRLEFTDSLG